ncbi:SDR family NAD(P)-dependent oxidoreductase [Trebonia sp.]|uniref:SDR family NAD(P)-dependent oxidoreductase n=1 Tax=Trebonia sp. TaxID=2767075 RepID=UPI0026145F9C|nr:SDR family NAD(P)-dependent oxidoreductase [Trebonia sp.]
MRQLTGRVAVVTGAASGIGRALAGRFAAEGMRCVLADIEEDALSAAVGELRSAGTPVIGVRTDVASAADVQALADATIAEFGAVHVLCNNAGVGGGTDFARIPLDTWEWVLGVNLWGVIHGCRTFLPLLVGQDEAHIVNTSSMAALNGHPLGLAPYTVSKFGVLGLSQNLFFELTATTGGRVGVSVLIPGLTRTRIFESTRNRPAGVTEPPASSFANTSRAMIAGAWDEAMQPSLVADVVADAIREQRFYVLPCADEAYDMAQQQLRWMRTNEPLVPGPGVARTADAAGS